jgi:hypothetical protein
MNWKSFIAVIGLSLPAFARAESHWILETSTLTYHVSHPLHHVEGVSHEARGKGGCQAGLCDFLIGVPVKSFDSGDSNRDLHMIQVVRGGAYPMVVVRTKLPENAAGSSTLKADLEIQFAGQTVRYAQVPFQRAIQGKESRITGTIPATVSDFKIDPPSLLAVPIRNEMPITVDAAWRESQ